MPVAWPSDVESFVEEQAYASCLIQYGRKLFVAAVARFQWHQKELGVTGDDIQRRSDIVRDPEQHLTQRCECLRFKQVFLDATPCGTSRTGRGVQFIFFGLHRERFLEPWI